MDNVGKLVDRKEMMKLIDDFNTSSEKWLIEYDSHSAFPGISGKAHSRLYNIDEIVLAVETGSVQANIELDPYRRWYRIICPTSYFICVDEALKGVLYSSLLTAPDNILRFMIYKNLNPTFDVTPLLQIKGRDMLRRFMDYDHEDVKDVVETHYRDIEMRVRILLKEIALLYQEETGIPIITSPPPPRL